MAIMPGENGSDGAVLPWVAEPVEELMAQSIITLPLAPEIKMNFPSGSVLADTKIVNPT